MLFSIVLIASLLTFLYVVVSLRCASPAVLYLFVCMAQNSVPLSLGRMVSSFFFSCCRVCFSLLDRFGLNLEVCFKILCNLMKHLLRHSSEVASLVGGLDR